jgi:hypothetical protein
LVGDFSPGVDESSLPNFPLNRPLPNLLAKKYSVNISGTFTPIAETTDLRRLDISSGQASLFKLGEFTASAVVDVSTGGKSFAILPSKDATARLDETLKGARTVVDRYVQGINSGCSPFGTDNPSYPAGLNIGYVGNTGDIVDYQSGSTSQWCQALVSYDSNSGLLTYININVDRTYGQPAAGCSKYYAGNLRLMGSTFEVTSKQFAGEICSDRISAGDVPNPYGYSGETLGSAKSYSISPPTVAGGYETVKVFTDWSSTVPEFTVGGKRNSVTDVASGSPIDGLIKGSKINLAASIRTAAGVLSGELLIDQLNKNV